MTACGPFWGKYRGIVSDNQDPLMTGRELIQLQHKQAGCNRFIVEAGQLLDLL